MMMYWGVTSMDSRTIFTALKPKPSRHSVKRLFMIGGLSLIGTIASLVPTLSVSATPFSLEKQVLLTQGTDLLAQTQTFSLETIWRYAAALQEINPIREAHNEEINQILKLNRPDRVCYQNNIPWEVQQSCDMFGSKMINILRKHEVDDVYTPISVQVQSDDNLKKKIQKAGVCQQRGVTLENCF